MSRLCVVEVGVLRGALELEAHTLADSPTVSLAELLSTGDGWLARLSAASGSPLGLDLFVLRGVIEPAAPWVELDPFALATVYGQVIWDAGMPAWHAASGRPDSATLLRRFHDLALRAYRNHDEGERLVLALR